LQGKKGKKKGKECLIKKKGMVKAYWGNGDQEGKHKKNSEVGEKKKVGMCPGVVKGQHLLFTSTETWGEKRSSQKDHTRKKVGGANKRKPY